MNRKTVRQKDRSMNRKTERQKEGQRDRKTEGGTEKQKDGQEKTEGGTERQKEGHKESKTERQNGNIFILFLFATTAPVYCRNHWLLVGPQEIKRWSLLGMAQHWTGSDTRPIQQLGSQ
jgi:hypothetical protein